MHIGMKDGFQAGSGVDPSSMHSMLALIGSAVILTVFASLVLGLFNAFKDEQLTLAEAIWGCIKLASLMGFVFYAVF